MRDHPDPYLSSRPGICLREFRSEPLHAAFVIRLDLRPLLLRINADEFEFDSADGDGLFCMNFFSAT